MTRLVPLLLCCALLAAPRSGMGQAREWLVRPALSRSADTNDWQSYFDYAVSIIDAWPTRADTALRWAARLDPTVADPLFARWVAFWLMDLRRFQEWLVDDPRTLSSAAVQSADTLFARAVQRNPFVPRMLFVLPFNKLPGRWREDLATQGILAYARLDYQKAADYFARYIRRNPERYVQWRWYRALAFVGARSFDSAHANMTAMASTLRAGAESTFSRWYESLELAEYGIGMLELARGRVEPARAAFQRSLEENLGFFPSHAMLGDIALAAGQPAVAARELSQAVELAPDEAWMQYRLGAALVRMGRRAEAVASLQRAIELEPFFADPYLALGDALERRGDREGAMQAFGEYLRRAPRRMTTQIDYAQRRLSALSRAP
jgi:tetratricopeptide (TPR) repeat protein